MFRRFRRLTSTPTPPVTGRGGNHISTVGDSCRPPIPNGQEQLTSPPIPRGSSSIDCLWQPPNEGYPTGRAGGDRPPTSVATANLRTGLDPQRIGFLSSEEAHLEATPIEHHAALKEFLEAHPRSEKRGQPPPEKLIRLSPIQFQELSTDVFDEVLRRRRSNVPNSGNPPPPFLRPRTSFHPKRNQARLRLSTLKRFHDLAFDVCDELERRFPMFVGGDEGADFGDDETLVGDGDD